MARPKGSTGTKQLSTEERQRIRTLYFDGYLSQSLIQERTGFTKAQIQTAIRANDATASRSSGRPATITPQQEEELVEFVCGSKRNRRMGYLELSMALFAGMLGMYVIKRALYRLGFRRRIARRKPPLSEKNQRLRVAWAEEHKNWTFEQWAEILWTDETWVTGGHHRRQYVTRRQGEEWDETCIVERHQRKHGWMFWGSFAGTRKGPGVFWEKDWGKINEESYREHIVPIIDGWIRWCRGLFGEALVLMQDGASGHAARGTQADLRERGVTVIHWPPYSPDLNPIESVWNWMKDWIEDKYGLEENPGYDALRRYVKEAWDAVPDDYFRDLLVQMPQRCQAVIDAEGKHTKY